MRFQLAISAVLIALGASGAMAQPEAATTPPPANTASSSSADDLRVRCRRMTVTGSLARQERVCMTVAEWRSFNDRGNRIARDLVDTANRCGGGAACQQGN